MAANFKNRRKNYFIKKKFQTIFILKFCALVIAGSIISGIVIYAMSGATVTTTFENSRLVMKSTADFILPAVLLSSAIVIAIIGLATIFMTLFTSHRIAGPLYRMEQDIKEVAAGNLTKEFKLRRTDEIKALAESLDNMTQGLRYDVEKIRSSVTELESKAGSSELRDIAERIKDILSKFKT